MTEKIKTWWSEDGKWFCILVNDGVNQATISLTRREARQLAGDVRAAPFMGTLEIPTDASLAGIQQLAELVQK